MFLCDRKILLGIGIGIMLGVFFTIPVKYNKNLNKGEIEIEAKKLGMSYPEDMKINIGED